MWLAVLLAACTEYNVGGWPDEVIDPPDCVLPESALPAPDLLEDCASEPQVGNFTPTVEWTWTDNPFHPGYHQVMAAPAIADVDGDGISDVVFTAFLGQAYYAAGALVCISGADGSTLWSVMDANGALPYGSSGVAIADLYGNGDPTILVSSTQGLLAVDRHGAFRWVAPVPFNAYAHPSVGEMDGDGVAEIVYGASVVNADGTVRWTGTGGAGGSSWAAWMSFPADVDQDGRAEVVTGNTLYNYDGTIRWNDGGPDGYPAIADLDLDGTPEIVRVSYGLVRANRIDGTVLWDFPITDGGGGPPTIADFDGDGAPEIGVASRSVYRVIEPNGTERWQRAVQDYSSSVTGSSVFDFEGDGAAEVVYADEETLWIYDGVTGAVEMAWGSHSSWTLLEYPVIVDVDGDGATEIVVASNDCTYPGSRGITVIGDAADSWAPARTVWNQHAYHIVNVEDDGSTPVAEAPSWLSWNSFRAGNSQTATGLAQSDVELGEPDLCVNECSDGNLVVYLPLSNRGQADAQDIRVGVYTDDDGGVLVGEELEVPLLEPGNVVWVGPFEIPVDAGSELVVLASPALDNECVRTNNASWLDLSCESAP